MKARFTDNAGNAEGPIISDATAAVAYRAPVLSSVTTSGDDLGGAVIWSWVKPSNASEIWRYEYTGSGESGWVELTGDAALTTKALTATEFEAGDTDFRIRVQYGTAQDDLEAGPESNTVSTPLRFVPRAPADLATVAQVGAVALSWTAPATDGGSAITDYEVQYREPPQTEEDWPATTWTSTGSTAASHTVTGLAQATKFEFRVRAVNATGPSAASSVGAATTLAEQQEPPRVASIVRRSPSSSPTNADALTWRVTFSEDVKNVNDADFAVSGTTATLSVSEVTASTVYDVKASGGDLANLNATATLAFANGQNILDLADIALSNTTPTGTNDNTYAVDNTAPRVTSIERQAPSSSPTNANTLTWRVTFGEDVKNVNGTDFTVGGTTAMLTVSEVTASTVVRRDRLRGNLAGLNATAALAFASSRNIADTAGNTLTNTTPTGTNDNTYAVDNTAPRVASIARRTPSSSPTNADALTWRVTFSEDVKNLDDADFTVSGTTAGLAVSEVTASTVYDVTASGGDLASLSATVTLAFASTRNIADTAGNTLTNTTPTGTNDNTYAVDNTAPRVASIVRRTPSSSPTNADTLTWRVTFSEDVENVDRADFTVSGPTGATLSVSEVTASTVYDVTASGGDLASLDATATLAFASTRNILDTVGNALSNTAPTGTNDNTYAVDNTAPRVVSIVRRTAVVVADEREHADVAGDVRRGREKREQYGLHGGRHDGDAGGERGDGVDGVRRDRVRGRPRGPERHGGACVRKQPEHRRHGRPRPFERHADGDQRQHLCGRQHGADGDDHGGAGDEHGGVHGDVHLLGGGVGLRRGRHHGGQRRGLGVHGDGRGYGVHGAHHAGGRRFGDGGRGGGERGGRGGQRQHRGRACDVHLHRAGGGQHGPAGDVDRAADAVVVADERGHADVAGDVRRGREERGRGGFPGERADRGHALGERGDGVDGL